jgi:putative membrane protein
MACWARALNHVGHNLRHIELSVRRPARGGGIASALMKHIVPACLLSLAAVCAYGADTDSAAGASAAQMFVTKATQDGLTEVELGKLAQTRSSNPEVKAFAARMVSDHTKANAELSTIAKSKNLNVPTQLDGKHATILHSVGTKPASEFDAEYAKRMIEAHNSAVTLFSDASAVRDKELSDFAKKTLPTLHEHQQLAAALPAKRPAPAGSAGAASAIPPEVPATPVAEPAHEPPPR